MTRPRLSTAGAKNRPPSFAFELNRLSREIDAALIARAGGAVLASVTGLGLMLAPSLVHADTFTVTKLADTNDGTCDTDCSLREAIGAANTLDNGPATVDEITFDSTLSGTITLGGTEIAVTDELTITGPGAADLTVDANDLSRIFNATSATSLTTISGLTLTNGDSAGLGGAIFADSDLALEAVVIQNSAATYGGGFFTFGNATLTNSTVSGNTANYSGGGFLVNNGDATLTNSTVSANTANFAGGFFAYNGGATLTNSTVSGNTANYGGGGFAVSSGDATLANSTVSANTTNTYGGGFLVYGGGNATLTHSTVSGNTANYNGGGFSVYSGDATLENSIVANNTAPTNPAFSVSGALSASYTLVEGDSSPAVTATNGNIVGTDPGLGLLQDNGGPTYTHALDSTSPAFNAGDPAFAPPPAFDQRGTGFPRVALGQLDMGAFEFQEPISGPTSIPALGPLGLLLLPLLIPIAGWRYLRKRWI